MNKQRQNAELLKKCHIATRLHNAPVFKLYKPANEKARLNLMYRGAILWNDLHAKTRNSNFTDFKNLLKKEIGV